MKAINNIISIFEKHRDQHLERAKRLDESIRSLQKLCPHERMVWIGNNHNHDIYRCSACGLEMEH